MKEGFSYPMQNEGVQPFFITSPGRSGSTLLRKMLMNGQVHIPPECDEMMVKILLDYPQHRKESWLLRSERVVQHYAASGLETYWGIPVEDFRDHLLRTPSHLENLRTQLWSLHELHKLKFDPAAIICGDKTPLHAEWMPWLKLVCPLSPFIFITRDVRELVHSRMKHFNESMEQAFSRFRLAWEAMEKFRRNEPSSLVFVQYEDLVLHPQRTMIQICAHLRIDFDQRMIHGNRIPEGDTVLAHHANVHAPLSHSHLNTARSLYDLRFESGVLKLVRQAGLTNEVFHHQTDPV